MVYVFSKKKKREFDFSLKIFSEYISLCPKKFLKYEGDKLIFKMFLCGEYVLKEQNCPENKRGMQRDSCNSKFFNDLLG